MRTLTWSLQWSQEQGHMDSGTSSPSEISTHDLVNALKATTNSQLMALEAGPGPGGGASPTWLYLPSLTSFCLLRNQSGILYWRGFCMMVTTRSTWTQTHLQHRS